MAKELVLFIHGLGGNPTDTWRGFPEIVQADEDLRSCADLGYFHYPTSLFRVPFSKKFPRIQTLARALRTQITNTFKEYEVITLVCHSLGGLIARKYLIDEVQRGSPLRVKRLLLFAVPNNGASMASVAKHISWWHGQLVQLCKTSDLIDELNEVWFTLKVGEKVRVKYVVAAQDKVVDEISARSFWGNPDVEVLADRGHRNCVKPSKPSDLSFLILKNFVLSPVSDDDVRAPAVKQIQPFQFKDVPWGSLQPLYIESFTPYDESPQTRQRIFGGSLIYGQRDAWSGELVGGTYQLRNTEGKNDAHYFYAQVFDNVTSEAIDTSEAIASVDVKIDFTENSTAFTGAGLIYRFNLQTKFYYAFVIQRDHSFMFYKRNANGYQEIYSGHSDSIRTGVINKLAIVGNGPVFHLFFNDAWIKTLEDTEFELGEVGIIAMSIGVTSFDNFAIYKTPIGTTSK